MSNEQQAAARSNQITYAEFRKALAKAEWTDKSQPLVDTQEYRQLLQDLIAQQAPPPLLARGKTTAFY